MGTIIPNEPLKGERSPKQSHLSANSKDTLVHKWAHRQSGLTNKISHDWTGI